MGEAGGSARAEYKRRRAKDRERIRSNFGQRIAVLLLTPVAAFVAVGIVLPGLVEGAIDSAADSIDEEDAGGTDASRSDDGSMWTLAGAVAAVGSTAAVGQQLFGRRQSTEAWRIGAVGEVQTARILGRLPSGFIVHHDLPIPRSRANIDNFVIGPTGAFTIETKHYKYGVKIRGGRVTASGRTRDGIVVQAQRQAQAMSGRVGLRVDPIVVVHGGVDVGWFSSPVVDGVRFCSPRRLRKTLTAADGRLTADGIAAADRLIAPRSPTDDPERPMETVSHAEQATKETGGCTCGGVWIQRRRRADGAAFLGCSRFPSCRRTLPLPGASTPAADD